LFPIDINLDQVLKAINNHKEFFVSNGGDYISVDYHYVEQDSFDDPIRKECRGIKFKPNGELLARPYHKFFNFGEKPESTDVDWSIPYDVFDKIDGSMVHGAIVNDELVLMTRKGRTDVAIAAEKCLTDDLRLFILSNLLLGISPIFEYVGPDNRVVLFYPENKLILTALRWNKSGLYVPPRKALGVEIVTTWQIANGTNIPEFIRTIKGIEGVVIRWNNGHMLKIKTDEYVNIHKAKEQIADERKLVSLILLNKLDDVLPVLPKDEAAYVMQMVSKVYALIKVQTNLFVMEYNEASMQFPNFRKAFAQYVQSNLPRHLQGAAFKWLDDHTLLPIQLVKDSLLTLTTSTTKYKELKDMLNG